MSNTVQQRNAVSLWDRVALAEEAVQAAPQNASVLALAVSVVKESYQQARVMLTDLYGPELAKPKSSQVPADPKAQFKYYVENLRAFAACNPLAVAAAGGSAPGGVAQAALEVAPQAMAERTPELQNLPAAQQDPLVTEYGFEMTPTDESHFECGELSIKTKPDELRRVVAGKLNAKFAELKMDYRISDWLLKSAEMNQPFDKDVVSGLVGKDSNVKTRRAQKGQMGKNNTFTNRADWVILLAFHRLATKGEDHSLEEKAFRTEPGAVWSGARALHDSYYWRGSDVSEGDFLFAARSRISSP